MRVTPGVKAPKPALEPSVSESVGGTVPVTGPGTLVLWKNVVGVSAGFDGVEIHWRQYSSSLARFEASKPAFSAAIRVASATTCAPVIVPYAYSVTSAFWKAKNAVSPTICR